MLNSVQLGVQMRLTIGQMPVECRTCPLTSPADAGHDQDQNFWPLVRGLRSSSPAIRPKIIVASEGMKLSVR